MSDSEPYGRRLPVYLVLDCSGSMRGEPIQAVKHGISTLLSELRSDPQALETVWLSVITFDSSARQVLPLTPLMHFEEPSIDATGSTALGDALTLLSSCIDKEVRKTTADQKGDLKPLIILMTDGEPTDAWEGPADAIKQKRPGNFIACGAGPSVNESTLKRITEVVCHLKDIQPETVWACFRWPPPPSAQELFRIAAVRREGLVKEREALFRDPPPPPAQIQIIP